MSEYIVNVPDVEAAYFIKHFGFEDVTMLGYHMTGEIVRCRDCAHLNIIGKCPCGFWALEDLDGFCAWAVKRKEGGE